MQFLEGMQLNYNRQAAEKGVYIIGSCGFDSIPADMGVLYTRDQFKGTYLHLGIDNETHLDSIQSVRCGACYLFICRYIDCSRELPDHQSRT